MLKKRSGIMSAKLRKFFKQPVIGALFVKRSTIIGHKRFYTIGEAIIEEIVLELMLPAACENDGSDGDDSKHFYLVIVV